MWTLRSLMMAAASMLRATYHLMCVPVAHQQRAKAIESRMCGVGDPAPSGAKRLPPFCVACRGDELPELHGAPSLDRIHFHSLSNRARVSRTDPDSRVTKKRVTVPFPTHGLESRPYLVPCSFA